MIRTDTIQWGDREGPDWEIRRINKICLQAGSEERLGVLLALTRLKPANVFWPVFYHNWLHCDDTWYSRRELLSSLKRHNAEEPGVGYLSDQAREFLDSLPDPVQVFRGCSSRRTRGVSWTTDQGVAESFARGHRGVSVPAPVIAVGMVARSAIYGVLVDRGESEVVLDPHRRQFSISELLPGRLF